MIKIDEKKFYMTFGEGCLVLVRDGDGVRSACFGARVEPEDDMFALLCALSDDSDRIGSAEIYESDGLDFKFVGAEIVQKPSCDMPALGGDKTLKLTFADAEKNVEQILYYTPYSRGGVARRTEIINNGTKPIKLKGIGQQFALPAGLEKLTECGIGGVVGERRGAAYGFCAMYGGECVFDVAQSAGDTHVYVGIDLGGAYKLGSGMTLRSPEILAVYSEAGTDGVSRVFHDILRERTVKNRRRALAVEYADEVADIDATVAAAAELGTDTFVTNANSAELKALSEACKTAGIGLGLRLDADIRMGTHAMFDILGDVEIVKTDDNGNKYFNFGETAARNFITGYFTGLFGEFECSFAAMPKELPALGGVKLYGYLLGQYAFFAKLNEAMPDLVIEGACGDAGALAYASSVYCSMPELIKYSVYFPPCALACKGEKTARPKAAFDTASLFGLGYSFDPVALSEPLRRAVRAQVFSYQDDARLVNDGDFYRGAGYAVCVSKDKSKAYAVFWNNGAGGTMEFVGADAHNLYHVRELGKTFSGAALVRHGIPVCSLQSGDTLSFHLQQVADYE